jgi:HlyD family secretion protein
VTEAVKSGTFRITVNERGQLDSLRNASVVNTVEGARTIVWIIPEGSKVQEGDLLCRLDSSELEDKEIQQQIQVTQAKADLKKGEENIEIQERQNESDVAAATLAWELAQLDLDGFKNGEYDRDKNVLIGERDLALEELNQATEVYLFTKRVAKKGYRSQNEVETARIAVAKAQNKVNVTEGELAVLEKFTYNRTLKELTENAAETERELERAKRRGQATLAQFQAEYEACKLNYDVELTKLKRLQNQIAACTLRAPQAGEVVYANQRSRRSEPAVIEEGATVRERQTIINLPDLTQMKVDARIHESKISQLVNRAESQLPVLVRIDAFPGEAFNGVLDSVSSVPVPGSWPNYDLKEYEAVVRITEPIEKVRRLRPGLTASLEIVVKQRSNVRQVPVQAVLSIGGQYYSYVLTLDGPERRIVQLGETNDKFIEILDGLEVGERVILNPRNQFAKELAELEAAAGDGEDDNDDEESPQTESGESTTL